MTPLDLATALDHLRGEIADGRIAPAVQGLIARLEVGRAGVPEWIAAGEQLLQAHAPAAVAFLDAGTRRWPSATSLRYLLGNGLRMSGRARDAETELRRVVAAEPAHADASTSLAYLLREQGRMSELAQVIVDLWRNSPRSRAGDVRTLLFLRECQRHVEAEALLPAMLAAHPGDAQLQTLGGETALALGRFGEAQRRFQNALAVDPAQAAAWLRLAHTHRFTSVDDPDLLALKKANARNDLDDESRVCIGFGLGKALDDLAEYAGAAEVLRSANARQRARRTWDAQGWERFIDAQMRSAAIPAAPIIAGITPVFVVGMPRSGTTLVASLLARDALVRNRSELNWIAAFAGHLGPAPSAAALAMAGQAYLTQLRQDDPPAQLYIDKNPLNFRHLGLIAAMFPHARIVHCVRDPRDIALSLWSQHFAHEDLAWAYDFADIAAFSRGHSRLMSHWRARLSVPIFELDYAALVAEPAALFGRLREFLGLAAVDDSEPAAGDAAIATASVWQARQQIYATSVGRWRHYAPFLPELEA
ncbi:MAG: sulfotransferase [Tahibacter sp.]